MSFDQYTANVMKKVIMSSDNIWVKLDYKSQEEFDISVADAIEKKDMNTLLKIFSKYLDNESNEPFSEIVKYANLIIKLVPNDFEPEDDCSETYFLVYANLINHYIIINNPHEVINYLRMMIKKMNTGNDWNDSDFDLTKLVIEDTIYDVTIYFKDKDINEFCKCYKLLSKIDIFYCDSYDMGYYAKREYRNIEIPNDDLGFSISKWGEVMTGIEIMEEAMKEWNVIQRIKYYYQCKDFKKIESNLMEFLNSSIEPDREKDFQEIYKMIEQIDETKIKTVGMKMIKQLLHKQLDLLDLHFKYAPNADGYQEAKEHFYVTINKK